MSKSTDKFIEEFMRAFEATAEYLVEIEDIKAKIKIAHQKEYVKNLELNQALKKKDMDDVCERINDLLELNDDIHTLYKEETTCIRKYYEEIKAAAIASEQVIGKPVKTEVIN